MHSSTGMSCCDVLRGKNKSDGRVAHLVPCLHLRYRAGAPNYEKLETGLESVAWFCTERWVYLPGVCVGWIGLIRIPATLTLSPQKKNEESHHHHHQKDGFLWVIFGCHKFQCKAWLSQLVPGLRSDEGRQGRRGGLGGVPLCRLGPEWRYIASGKLLHNYGKSPFWIGKSTISMAIFNSYVTNYQGSHYFWNMLGYVGIWRSKHIRNSTSKISKIMNTYEHILVSATSRRRSRHPKNIRLSPGLVAFTVDLLQAVQPGIFFGKRFFVALELKGFWQLFFLGPELQCSWLFLNVFLFFVVTFPSWLEWARISTWLCQSPLMRWCWELLHDVPLFHDDNWTTVMGM